MISIPEIMAFAVRKSDYVN